MRTKLRIILIAAIVNFLFLAYSRAQEDHPNPVTLEIGSQAPSFNLRGVDDKMHSIDDYRKSNLLLVIFNCNHCPTAQAYEGRIISLYNDYLKKAVAIVVISPNSMKSLNYWEQGWSDLDDSYEAMKIRARDRNFPFPYLYDGDDQKVSIAYGPVATPHVFLFDKERKLQYEGGIDASQTSGKAEYIRNALDDLLAGKKIEKPVSKVFGCSTKWAWKTEGTNKLYKEWSELPVTIDEVDAGAIQELVKNNSGKLRLINVWASWCGPCVQEFPDLVMIDRIYRSRQFEFVSISADKLSRKESVLNFLKKKEASNKNFIYNSDNNSELVDAIDPSWQGALPYSILVEPGGNIIYRVQGTLDIIKVRKLIMGNKYIGD